MPSPLIIFSAAALTLSAQAAAETVPSGDLPYRQMVVPAAADCSAAAARVVQQTGGELLSVSAVDGGKACRVTVLVPGKDGSRRQRKTVVVRP